MNYLARQANLSARFHSNRLDAVLITHLPNVRYLCGFTGSSAVLIVDGEKSIFFTDGRYAEQSRSEVRAAKIVVGKKGAMVAATAWLRSAAARRSLRVGVEADRVSAATLAQLRSDLPKSIRLRPTTSLVEQLRMIKDADEIDQIRAAVNLGSRLFDGLLEVIRPGVTELDVAAELEYAAARQGAEGMSFPTIIASGERSALPHGRASRQPIPSSGFVVCDFGVILGGYCSDMTRTVFVGRPSADAKRFYQAVLAAQEAAVEAIAAGVSSAKVDGAARKSLQRNNLAAYFTHSTGHGVGLDLHEPPRVGAGQMESLASGMVITAEPGAYIPGRWGVRIEDMVVVTSSGCEVLTPTPKDLIAV
jgi:Xaa-Pro aminopeptidase